MQLHSSPRPKWNKKAKRDSGGLIVYYKHWLENKIELIKTDRRGKLWIKLKGNNSEDKNDVFICLLYIPPENSTVYKNVNSDLYEYDFFDDISDDILHFSNCGEVFLTGDFNSRVGVDSDFVENLDMQRFVDLPLLQTPDSFKLRKSSDLHVNNFGKKLLTLCKQHDLLIVNGRLENGDFT